MFNKGQRVQDGKPHAQIRPLLHPVNMADSYDDRYGDRGYDDRSYGGYVSKSGENKVRITKKKNQ